MSKELHQPPTRAPREPLTLDLIERAILHLMSAGKPPNEPNVRALLGGSPNALHPLIGRWFADRAPALLSGSLSVVNSDDLPAAAHALIAELRRDAMTAAHTAVEKAQAQADVEMAKARALTDAAQQAQDRLDRRSAEIDTLLPTIKADLELARAETAAARNAAEAAARDRREAITGREAAEAMLQAAEGRATRLDELLSLANASCGIAKGETKAVQQELDAARAEIARCQREIERVIGESAATAAALRASLDEVKAAHIREVQALRSAQSEAASRWAESKASLEKRASNAEAESDQLRRRHDEASGLVGGLKIEVATLKSALDEALRERDALRGRVDQAGASALASLAERIGSLESKSRASE